MTTRAPVASNRLTIHAPINPCAPVIRKLVSAILLSIRSSRSYDLPYLFSHSIERVIDSKLAQHRSLNSSPKHILYFGIARELWRNQNMLSDYIFEHRQTCSVLAICLALHLLHNASTHRHATVASLQQLLIIRCEMKQQIESFFFLCPLVRQRERVTAAVGE